MTIIAKTNLNNIPKAEIHVHLEGAIPIPTVLDLAKKNNIKLDHILTANSQNPHYDWQGDFIKFLYAYDETCKVLTNCQDYEIALNAYFDQSILEGVIYNETIISPGHVENLGINFGDFVETLEKVAVNYQSKGLEIRYIATFVRQLGIDDAYRNLEMIKNNKSEFITGVNLAGNESHGDIKHFKPVFDKASELGLGLTAHAGEIKGPDEIIDAINYLSISRIGHATSAILDQKAIDLISKKSICIESCPTSNIMTGSHFKSYKTHPFRKYFDQGLELTINSDDPPFFNTTIGNEYLIAKQEFNFNDKELLKLTKNAIKHAFVSDEVKQKIYKSIDEKRSPN